MSLGGPFRPSWTFAQGGVPQRMASTFSPRARAASTMPSTEATYAVFGTPLPPASNWHQQRSTRIQPIPTAASLSKSALRSASEAKSQVGWVVTPIAGTGTAAPGAAALDVAHARAHGSTTRAQRKAGERTQTFL